MRNHWTKIRIFTLLACCLAAGGASAFAQSVYSAGLFELGDGLAPPGFAGAADILGRAEQPGPDWGNLFTAAGGLQGGAHGAVFIADDVSLGSGFESTELAGSPDLVRNGTAAAVDDIGNAYVYSARDAAGRIVLFLGAERLSGGDSSLEFELNQSVVRLGHGGFGSGKPWKILGTRAANDALVRLDFASGALASVSFYRWRGGQWRLAASLAGEGCNEAETLCAVSNAAAVNGGPWRPGEIASGRFVEVGVNLGALFSANPVLSSIRIRTPDDIAFGYFAEGN